MEFVPNQKKLDIIPGLDSLRFFAFLAVFTSHSIFFLGTLKNTSLEVLTPYLTIGDLGVSAFFILSGFLITSLLITEKNIHGAISLRNFYIRRSLRIWPLYFLIVFLGIVLIPLLVPSNLFTDPYTLQGTGALWKFFTFTFNFGQPNDFMTISLVLGVLWSLSVEEQFYIVWPWIVKYFSRNKVLITLLSITGLSIIFRSLFAHNHSFVEYNTLSVMGDLALGGLLGFLFTNYKKIFQKITPRGSYAFFLSGITLVIITIILRPHLRESTLFTITEPLVFGLGIVSIITAIITHSRILSNRITVFLGKISYGLYMYHIIGMILAILISKHIVSLPLSLIVLISFCFTISISLLSFYFFEQPFLKFKSKFK